MEKIEHPASQNELTESSSAEQTPAPVFDREAMLRRMMGDEELARDIIGLFLEDVPKQINLLKGYLERNDVMNAGRQAHSIKGASANVGGEALRKLAEELEMSGRDGKIDEIACRINEVEDHFKQLTEKIKDF